MSTFIGQKFYDKAWTLAHPELHFQHRGKGRWYLVDSAAAAVPPPQRRLAKIKAEKGKEIKAEEEPPKRPKGPRPIRKRSAADLDDHDHVELKETRTRKGAARETAIDLDQPTKDSKPEGHRRARKRQKSDAAVASVEEDGSEIAVATANPVTKRKGPTKMKQAPPKNKKKKTRAPPKSRAAAVDRSMNYKFVAPQALSEERSLKSELQSDLDAFGITKEVLAKRRPEPLVDSATQRIGGTNRRNAEDRLAKIAVFNGKQMKVSKSRSAGKSKKTTATGPIQIIVADEGTDPGNWVLFDPRHGFPIIFGEPPECMERNAYYQPGNTRIVAHNTLSFACQLRRTPDAFAGHEVKYTKRGPKMVKMATQISVEETSNESEVDLEVESAAESEVQGPEVELEIQESEVVESETEEIETEDAEIEEPEVEKPEERADSPLSEIDSEIISNAA